MRRHDSSQEEFSIRSRNASDWQFSARMELAANYTVEQLMTVIFADPDTFDGIEDLERVEQEMKEAAAS